MERKQIGSLTKIEEKKLIHTKIKRSMKHFDGQYSFIKTAKVFINSIRHFKSQYPTLTVDSSDLV